MTITEQCITIGLCALGTQICRFLPFILFSGKSRLPHCIEYLGKALPLAVFGMLVVYCLKDVSFVQKDYGLPEMIAVIATALIHVLKRNMMLSIVLGTAIYMVLVQLVFVG